METSTSLIQAPVVLDECVIHVMDDGARYLVDRESGQRICKAYGFDDAGPGWRSKTSFFAKADEDGFWCAYDDRQVVSTLD